MNRADIKTRAEITGIRTRSRVRQLIQLVALAAVCIAGFNLVFAPIASMGPIGAEVYRPVAEPFVEAGTSFAADVGLLVAGIIVAWVV